MDTQPDDSSRQSLRSQYATKFTHDLDTNRAEQASLRARLDQLKADETWLVEVLETLSATAEGGFEAQETDKQPERSHDGTPGRVESNEASEAGSQTPPAGHVQMQDKPATASTKRAATRRNAAKDAHRNRAPQKAPASRAGGPPLGELLLTVLGEHAGQPRTANEVASELAQAYPERARNATTVRNTLERLVAKSRIERRKQKNTVLYTVIESSPVADNAPAHAPLQQPVNGTDTTHTEVTPKQA